MGTPAKIRKRSKSFAFDPAACSSFKYEDKQESEDEIKGIKIEKNMESEEDYIESNGADNSMKLPYETQLSILDMVKNQLPKFEVLPVLTRATFIDFKQISHELNVDEAIVKKFVITSLNKAKRMSPTVRSLLCLAENEILMAEQNIQRKIPPNLNAFYLDKQIKKPKYKDMPKKEIMGKLNKKFKKLNQEQLEKLKKEYEDFKANVKNNQNIQLKEELNYFLIKKFPKIVTFRTYFFYDKKMGNEIKTFGEAHTVWESLSFNEKVRYIEKFLKTDFHHSEKSLAKKEIQIIQKFYGRPMRNFKNYDELFENYLTQLQEKLPEFLTFECRIISNKKDKSKEKLNNEDGQNNENVVWTEPPIFYNTANKYYKKVYLNKYQDDSQNENWKTLDSKIKEKVKEEYHNYCENYRKQFVKYLETLNQEEVNHFKEENEEMFLKLQID